ncbi:MAG: hypothetical protein Q8L90_10535 [Bacteroidota bacterium]|nr:hypothetical protein [Bacteroidota bacterium]
MFITLIISCSPTHNYTLKRTELVTESDIHSIINKDNSLLYKAKINLYNRYYSGLIVLKQTSPGISHLVFITELGMKMFDFEIRNNQFKLIYVFEPLNKPNVLSLLENDLKLILLQNLLNKEAKVYERNDQDKRIYQTMNNKLKNYYFLSASTKTVERTIVKGKVFIKENVEYIYNDSLVAKHIKLKHKGIIRLKIELNKLSTKL